MLLCGMPALATDIAPNYNLIPINYPGGIVTNPLGINSQGVIVGNYIDPITFADHGFLWENGQYFPVDYPLADPGIGSGAGGINDQNQIVGVWMDQNGTQHGYLATLQPGCTDIAQAGCSTLNYQSFDTTLPDASLNPAVDFELGTGLGTAPIGINNAGAISGMYGLGTYSNGFLLTGGINGTYQEYSNPNASNFDVAVPENNQVVLEGLGTKFFGIGNSGIVAGDYVDPTGITHGFLLPNGLSNPALTVDVPGSDVGPFGAQVTSANTSNMAVGVYADGTGVFRGFLYNIGGNQYYDFNAPGQEYTELHTINDRGFITGASIGDLTNDATQAATYSGFLAVPTPEPASFLMVAAGAAMAALRLRRKRA
jgi:hypothetical protein